MRPFVYIFLLAFALMLFKTFYLDYKKKEVPAENNTSVDVTQGNVRPVAEAEKKPSQSNEKMPLDKLGDSIGDSLKDKIKVK